MLTFSAVLSLITNGYGIAKAEEGADVGNVGKLAESCILIKQSNNLSYLEEIALNLPDGFLWIERDNGGYILKAKLDDQQIDRYRERIGNLHYISCETSYENWVAKREKITLKDLGYSDTIFIEGNNPYFHITFPIYKTFDKGKFFVRFSVSPIVNPKSSVAIKINKKTEKILKPSIEHNAFSVSVPIPKDENRKYVDISIDGYLRAGDNICDDLNTKNLFMKIDNNQSGFYVIRNLQLKTITNYFEDYTKNYYVESLNEEALKLAYYIPSTIKWLKVNVSPLYDKDGISRKVIYKNSHDRINLGKNLTDDTLSLGNADIVSPIGVKSLLTSSATNIYVENRTEDLRSHNEISLRDLGIKTETTNGVGILSMYIPFDTGRAGGIPDKLHLVLKVSNSAVDEHDRVNLELMVNGGLVKSYSIKNRVDGLKEYDIEIPKSLLQAGINNIYVKLNYYPSSDRCIGAVPKVNLTLYDDSYFYWNSARKEVNSVRDFINLANGKVAVVVEDKEYYPYALKFLNIMGQLNSNIDKLDIIKSTQKLGDNARKYDFIIVFSKNSKNILQKAEAPLKIDEKGFTIVDTERDKTLFSFKPEDKLGVIEVINYKDRPTLLITTINGAEALKGLEQFNYVNINSLVGNVALLNGDEVSTFSVGERLKVHYISQKGLSYYWNNYKAVILTALAILVILFEVFIFRHLVRNKKNNNNSEN